MDGIHGDLISRLPPGQSGDDRKKASATNCRSLFSIARSVYFPEPDPFNRFLFSYMTLSARSKTSAMEESFPANRDIPLVMLDEIREQRDWETWSASAASTTAKPNAVIICFSNAGDPDSIVLRQLRAQAISSITGEK